MRTKLILFVIAVLLFLYWHGINRTATEKGWNCSYHFAYAICNSKNSKAQLPSLWDVLVAGTKF